MSKDFKLREAAGTFFVGETVATFVVFVLSKIKTITLKENKLLNSIYVFVRIQPLRYFLCLREV